MRGDADTELADGIAELLAQHGLVGEVHGLRRLSGGASRETWSLDLVSGDRTHPLILQRLRAGTVSGGPGVTGEAALIRAAGDAGVPVPTVVAVDQGTAIGAPCLVVQRLEGETIPRKLLRDEVWATARSRLVGQAGAALAAVHALDPQVAPTLRDTDQLDDLRALLHGLDQPLPAFELAIRWLERHRPATARPAVVHGDFRLGNLLLDSSGLVGVLDWELAHIGDPAEDLGWFCVRAWRFGSTSPAGGMGSREELTHAYAAAGGREIDLDALRWWELLGTLKWGLICVVQARVHLSGAARSVELATIGRRVCENEWDVLRLLPGEELPAAEATVPTRADPLHGRPSSTELIAAVREWIDGDVRAAADGRLAFHARVAVNALRMVERELALLPAQRFAHDARLAALGCADDAELARQIRAGTLDARIDDVRAAVGASVRSKLEVANPEWLESDPG